MILNRTRLFAGLAVLWLLFDVLTVTKFNALNILNIVGFAALMFIPGFLIVLALRLKKVQFWEKLGYIIGFSLLSLMLTVLVENTLVQYFIKRPLDWLPLTISINILVWGLMVIAWFGSRDFKVVIKRPKIRYLDIAFIITPIVFVALSVFGAISLNNGDSDIFTMIALVGIAAYSGLLMALHNKLNQNVIPYAIFFTALSLLLMTSLRGWFITGHDIQREYRVFELAKNNGLWQISLFRDPYNACMSITILPTIFSNLLKISDPYVYKVLFQSIFAFVPVTVYLLARRYTSVLVAFLATLYFIAFPTFFTDMSFLNRQEIAFVFFSLMLCIIFNERISLPKRRILFMLFGVGLILSHYSTTYSALVILAASVAAWPILVRLGRRYHGRKLSPQSAIVMLRPKSKKESQYITVFMIILLLSGSLLWTGVLTDTGGSTGRVIVETLQAVGNGFKEDVPKSNETRYNLLSWSRPSADAQLADYVKNVVDVARAKDPGSYYPAAQYQGYGIKTATDTAMPLTSVGKMIAKTGLNVAGFNFLLKQGFAKLLQVLMIIGLLYVLARRKFVSSIPTEIMTLTIGSIVFILLQVVLPVISAEYGVLRAFQQALILVGIFIVLGSLAIQDILPVRFLRKSFAILLALLFFLSSTGVIAQLTGGYYAQLNLNNSGQYYDNYYLHKSEVLGIAWLGSAVKSSNNIQSEVQTDRYSQLKLQSTSEINSPLNDIYPGLVRKNSYVYLGYANVHKHEVTVSHGGNLLTYTYPVQFLDDNKNLVYNDGGSRVYR